MAKLSVIIITHNEEKNLRRCLESVKYADEIIINDSGSSDKTLDIALEFGCRTISTTFTGFGAAKQLALDQATGDWVLSIDADEELDEQLREAIIGAIRNEGIDGWRLNRKSQFLGRWITHSGCIRITSCVCLSVRRRDSLRVKCMKELKLMGKLGHYRDIYCIILTRMFRTI